VSRLTKDSFWFPKELGQRLAELRKSRGLTQQMVAVLMGRQGKGGKTVPHRLETGWFVSPSLRLVGDYLRAVGAGFPDVVDILSKYTSMPTAMHRGGTEAVAQALEKLPEKVIREAVHYDIKRAMADLAENRRPAEPAKRAERARKFAIRRLWIERMRREVIRLINSQALKPGGYDNETLLYDYGRTAWGALGRTAGAPAERRAELDRLKSEMDAQRVFDPRLVRLIHDGIVRLYERAELERALDRPPQ
jgi:transcriptional regulator with XRE-family HTH domain